MASNDEYQQRQFQSKECNIVRRGSNYLVERGGGIWRPIIIPMIKQSLDESDYAINLVLTVGTMYEVPIPPRDISKS